MAQLMAGLCTLLDNDRCDRKEQLIQRSRRLLRCSMFADRSERLALETRTGRGRIRRDDGGVSSRCIDCLEPMLDSDAKITLVCPMCQRLKGRPPMPVRDGRTDKQRRPVVYQMKRAFSYPEQE